MGKQRIQGNCNVQIQDVKRARIEITYNESSHTVPLEPAHVPVSKELPSPARLVRAHSGVVPYVDRGNLLTNLEAWVDSSEPFAGHVIEGRGGAGKTKLAVELCEKMRESHWLCGFLARIAKQERLDALVQAPTARLVVIDYAENRAEQVEMLLPLLQAKATAEEPVRVLLLVRTGSDRVTNWADRLGNRVDALDATLEGSQVQALEDTPLQVDDRRELFEVASTAFTDWLEREEPPAPPPDLEENVFENALMVVVAAYLAAHGERAPSTRGELLDEVLAHERRYWRESAEKLDADDALLERIVALATLINVEGEAEAAERLRLISDLADAPAERRNRLARWMRSQYPGLRWWNPLEPDPVGEHLVALCFADTPETLSGALAGSEPEKITRPLEVLARASITHRDIAATMTSILSEELVRLCKIAVAQARSTRDRDLLYGNVLTLAAAINAAISSVEVDSTVLFGAAGLMPLHPDVVMRDLAAELTGKEVELRRPLAAANPAAHLPELARALNNFSVRLSELGRREDALEAIEESVQIKRPLAAADPAAHLPELAGTLNNLSIRLSELGRREDALEAIEESVSIRRPLAASNPADNGCDLANALNSLSNRLSELGRREDALEAIEEALETYRPFVDADPGAHRPALAMTLNSLSIRLSELGRREDALEAIEESVSIRRPLAASNPAAHLHELANALNNLSIRLSELGRREEALAAIEESVEIYRPLATANAEAHGRDLAAALNSLSNRLSELDRREDALEAIEESVSIRRPLAAANPAAYLHELAGALNNLSNRLSELGRREDALEAIEESVEIYRPLATAKPSIHSPDLAMALNNLSNRLSELGRREDALEAIEESVEIYRPLAATNPAAYGPNLVTALSSFSDRLSEVGRDKDAEDARQEAARVSALPSDMTV